MIWGGNLFATPLAPMTFSICSQRNNGQSRIDTLGSPRRTGRYQFQALPQLRELLDLENSIDPATRKKIERVIDEFVPMDTQEAEVFATIYAAWNNLLIEGKVPSDEEIIRAARDEWHPSKRNIPQAKFVEGLRRIRASKFIPQGRGSFVPPPAQGQLAL